MAARRFVGASPCAGRGLAQQRDTDRTIDGVQGDHTETEDEAIDNEQQAKTKSQKIAFRLYPQLKANDYRSYIDWFNNHVVLEEQPEAQ